MTIRSIDSKKIEEAVAALCIEAACDLPEDVLAVIKKSAKSETSQLSREFFAQYIENARIAHSERLPICQDTGVAVFFIELGQDLHIGGGSLYDAVAKGLARGYTDGYLRKSMVCDPLFDRKNTGDNTPPVIHTFIVPGDRIKIIIAPKGAGSENMSAVSMMNPFASPEDIVNFVSDIVIKGGGKPCPPTVVGVGIGGNFEMSALLAKKALLRNIPSHNPDSRYAALEDAMFARINASGVGAQGLGGDITAFAVHIETYPCHIASLPVAVNINCHAARHKEIIL